MKGIVQNTINTVLGLNQLADRAQRLADIALGKYFANANDIYSLEWEVLGEAGKSLKDVFRGEEDSGVVQKLYTTIKTAAIEAAKGGKISDKNLSPNEVYPKPTADLFGKKKNCQGSYIPNLPSCLGSHGRRSYGDVAGGCE